MTAHARTTDPSTSHAAVPRIAKGGQQTLLEAARILGYFTDGQLKHQAEYMTERRWERGNVARQRKSLEDKGLVERTDGVDDGQIVFRITDAGAA